MIRSSRFVFELDVVLRDEGKIPSDTPAKFLSMSIFDEIVMVREYFDWVLCSKQKVSPVL